MVSTIVKPSDPITNLPNLYVNGLAISYATTTTLNIAAGACTDVTDTVDIVVPEVFNDSGDLVPSLVINTAQQGALGIDIGTVAASTFYAVYVVFDSFNANPVTAVLSLSATQPTLPFGYNSFRRIGYVLTDGSSRILSFNQAIAGNGSNRTMWYDAGISVLSGGSSATFAAQSLVTAVPPFATEVMFQATVTPTGAGDALALRPTGSSSSAGYAVLSGAVATVAQKAQLVCPCLLSSSVPSIDYKVTGTASLVVSAYVDQL